MASPAEGEDYIPPKMWYHIRDIFSRLDELAEEQLKVMREIRDLLGGVAPPPIPPDELTAKLEELLSYIRPVEDYLYKSDTVTNITPKTYEMESLLGRHPTSGYITNDGTANITFKINDKEKITLESEEINSFGETKRLLRVKKMVVETTSSSSQAFRFWLW